VSADRAVPERPVTSEANARLLEALAITPEANARILKTLAVHERLEERGTVLNETSPPKLAMWTIYTLDEPEALRILADRLEATGATLLGVQSTGFGHPEETTLQVFVDLSTNWKVTDV
jgi:hypothetical protein